MLVVVMLVVVILVVVMLVVMMLVVVMLVVVMIVVVMIVVIVMLDVLNEIVGFVGALVSACSLARAASCFFCPGNTAYTVQQIT